eukprot:727653_1
MVLNLYAITNVAFVSWIIDDWYRTIEYLLHNPSIGSDEHNSRHSIYRTHLFLHLQPRLVYDGPVQPALHMHVLLLHVPNHSQSHCRYMYTRLTRMKQRDGPKDVRFHI